MTIPFGSAHTYIAHIREYPPSQPLGNEPQEWRTLITKHELERFRLNFSRCVKHDQALSVFDLFALCRQETHHQEPATTPYSCHGVFTDQSIFSLNLSRIQITTSVTNCSQKHGLMLTCSREAALFYPYRSVLM